jgi:outer membrane murein-binding lipoprotein Lpp
MSLGMADRQARARRQLLWAFVKWTVALVLVALAGLFAYQTGTSLAQIDIQRLNERVAELTTQVEILQTENAGLRAQAARAQEQARQAEERVKAVQPTGDAKTLLDLATQRLNEGVDMTRLTFLLNAAGAPRVCDPQPETKRFLVKTPNGKAGKEATAAFADRRITVTADGAAAVDTGGKAQAWFDPQQPVTVRFTVADGPSSEATGVLPLAHRLIVGSSEYRFSIAADEKKSYAVITGERCNFP